MYAILSNDRMAGERWIVQDLEKSGRGVFELHSCILLERLRNTENTLVSVAGVAGKIRNKHLPNANLERYRGTSNGRLWATVR
jgi:hypothetical protein